jgi:type II secretory pathway pseudopilin PulG
MKTNRKPASLRKQGGFTFIELGAVIIIIVVLGALVTPRIREVLIGGRVPTSGQDLAKGIAQLKQAAAVSQSTTPFATLPGPAQIFPGSNFKVSSTFVIHDLGVAGGRVVVDSIASGAAASITVWGINSAACPGLATAVNKAADAVEIGQGGTVTTPAAPSAPTAVPTAVSTNVVKIAGGNYDGVAAGAACNTTGEHNYIRFYVNP